MYYQNWMLGVECWLLNVSYIFRLALLVFTASMNAVMSALGEPEPAR